MSRRNYIGIIIVIVILLFDTVVYKYQRVSSSNEVLLRCSPAGKILSSMESNGDSEYDSIYNIIKPAK